MKKFLYIFTLFFMFILFININIFAKPMNIYNLQITISIVNIVEISDYELSRIIGEVITNSVSDSKGQKPKVYAWKVGITGSEVDGGIIVTENGVFLYEIVWPDGVITYQSINPYTGYNGYLITDSCPNTSY